MENLERFKELAEKHNTEIILEWDESCDWFFYEEDGACGYPLQISTSKPNQLVPSENIYSAIGESVYSLAEAIMDEDVKRLKRHQDLDMLHMVLDFVENHFL